MEDGEIASESQGSRGKRPWERQPPRINHTIPYRRHDRLDNRSYHHNDRRQEEQCSDHAVAQNHGAKVRGPSIPSRSRSNDRFRHSSSSNPRNNNGGFCRSSSSRSDSSSGLRTSDQMRDHSRFGNAAQKSFCIKTPHDASSSLKNRWEPPEKKKEAELKRDSTDQGESAYDMRRGRVLPGCHQSRLEFSNEDSKSEAIPPQSVQKGLALESTQETNHEINKEGLISLSNESSVGYVIKASVELKVVSTDDAKMGVGVNVKSQGTTPKAEISTSETVAAITVRSIKGKVSLESQEVGAADEKISKWISAPKSRKTGSLVKNLGDVLQRTKGGREMSPLKNDASLRKDSISRRITEKCIKTTDTRILFETPNADTDMYSPSVVSDDGPYATEASFGSTKSEHSHANTAVPEVNKLHLSCSSNDTSDWSPLHVISTIKVAHSPTPITTSEKSVKESSNGMKCQLHESIESDSSSDSETDEEEVLIWAERMFGVTPPGLLKLRQQHVAESDRDSSEEEDADGEAHQVVPRTTKLRHKPFTQTKKNGLSRKRKSSLNVEEAQKKAVEDGKRKKEEAKPLTAAEIRAILGEDLNVAPSSHWVRRSSRQPCKAALQTPGVRALIDKLLRNDSDMVVLKMKKYVNDPDTPQVVIDAALDALEENTNCQALYIQNFNRGVHDEQVLHLLKILQLPTCKIWCLNIGETYNVKSSTWKKFARGLRLTKVTHMYASEHTIDGELKEYIRDTIRSNRNKHDMHCNPDNLDVIVQCTHCWWNPMNAKVLRPYLRNKGYEHILKDKEAQGLRGSMSGSTLGGDSETIHHRD